MANYREQPVTGTKWVRSNRVTIINPYQGTPKIAFGEEEIATLSDGRTVSSNMEGIVQAFDNPATEFDLIDPTTGAPTGQKASYGQVYVLLHSLYFSLAAKRDYEAAMAEQPAE